MRTCRRMSLTLVAIALAGGCSSPPPAAAPATTPTAAGESTTTAAPTTTSLTTTSPTATSPTTATPEPVQDRSVRLRFTGDMLPSNEMQEQAARNAGGDGFDFAPMLAEVAPLIADADFSVCHQETPVSDDNTGLAGYPSFNAPRELAVAQVAAGYDSCSTASNHTVDLGADGIEATLNTLDAEGLRHTGSARNPEEQAAPPIYDVQGARVGHLSYTYGLNGQQAPTPWAVNLIDPARIRADAAAIRGAGAQIVVVSLHFGTEKDQVPSQYQEQVVAEVMAGPETDLVIGHHAHVVQPAQQLPDGRWVFFGLGNFLAQMEVTDDPTPPHRDGVIAEVTFTEGPDGQWATTAAGYIPTFVDAPTDVVRLAPDFSRQRTTEVLTSRGAPLVDLTP